MTKSPTHQQVELFPLMGSSGSKEWLEPPISKTVLAKDRLSSLDSFLSQTVIGVDEAGRGPLAGDVYASAVVLEPHVQIAGLTDSKKLTTKQRENLVEEIKEKSLAWSIASASVEEIDQWGILHATMLAMVRALAQISSATQYPILIDGNRNLLVPMMQTEAVVKGDERVLAISAASVLAKTARDEYMLQLDRQYPNYGFSQHKGYGTSLHQAAIVQYGVLPIHRRKFGLIKQILEEIELKGGML